jgi:hypothetical protein
MGFSRYLFAANGGALIPVLALKPPGLAKVALWSKFSKTFEEIPIALYTMM